MHNYWSADFETTTDPNDCRVWAYALSNIENPDEFIYGNSISDFFNWCYESKHNYTLYFFNLKFDGSFILSWLLEAGFEFIEDKKDKRDMTFTTLITDMGQFYSIEIYFEVDGHKVNKVKILDAMKIFPNFSVERIAKGFNLPISKLKIDYTKYRPENHELTETEIAYIRNDVEIVARALHEMFDRGLTKMTIASDAMTNFKKHFDNFFHYFPELPEKVDADIRLSYRGGFTYASDKYTETEIGEGCVLDVNSLYPYCMKNKPMPYGEPRFFEGEYITDDIFPLFIITFTCKFEIKPDKIPCIQLKNNLSFIPNEYLKSSKDEHVTLTLTSVDFELFKDHYKFWDVTYHGGWKFKMTIGLFDNYVDYWTEQKIKAGKEGNAAQRQIAKLMLNSLYGKFGVSINCGKKAPMLNEDGILSFVDLTPEKRKPIYIPVAAFITAYGREKTIRTSQAIRDYTTKKYGVDKYYYSDTDSIHSGLNNEDLEELKELLDIDDFKLGAWAKEAEFTRAIYIRQKCYIEEIEDTVSVTVAGLPKYLAPIITFDNFKRGFSTGEMSFQDMRELAMKNGAKPDDIENIHHKFTYKYVKGGVILADTDFTIK
ncbi:MAG: hypothetical protein J6S85_01185 [Methanobrevibacter sp.]|nr:hypothetical protein [Methanobrevibacter sp.]